MLHHQHLVLSGKYYMRGKKKKNMEINDRIEMVFSRAAFGMKRIFRNMLNMFHLYFLMHVYTFFTHTHIDECAV